MQFDTRDRLMKCLESFFFSFWHSSWVGRTEPWESWALAPVPGSVADILWFRARDMASAPNYYRTDWEESRARVWTVSSLLGFQKIGKVILQTAAKPHAPQPVSSGQVVKRELLKPKPEPVLVLDPCWAAGHGSRTEAWESVIRKGGARFGNPSDCGMSAWMH